MAIEFLGDKPVTTMRRLLLQSGLLVLLVVGRSSASAPMAVKWVIAGYKFSANVLTLHVTDGKPAQLYLFYNTSAHPLLLSHPHQLRGVSAGWDSLLYSKRWSVFIVDNPHFVISCSIVHKQTDSNTKVACADVLTVRRYRINKKFIANPHGYGTFWLSENNAIPLNKTNIAAMLEKRGLIIDTHCQ